MNTHNRLLIVIGLLLCAVPLGTSVLLLGDLREEARENLTMAVGEAQDGYRKSLNLSVYESANRKAAEKAKARVDELAKKKREVRLKIVELRESLATLAGDAWAYANREADARVAAASSRDMLADFFRESYIRRLDVSSRDLGLSALRRLRGETLQRDLDDTLSGQVIARARGEVIGRLLVSNDTLSLSQSRLHAAAGDIGTQITQLQNEWETLTTQYREAERDYERALSSAELNEQQLAEIRAITAEVQSEILRMQGELARIDARLKNQAERRLIQLGLREERPDRYKEGVGGGPAFMWPVNGPVSAGFLQESYKRFFGVPHKGIDIVVPQKTAVLSAADGIVFLARDGGARGYSYILVGHRDGYATLYGHLSSFSVQAGQEVMKGAVLGLSGGTPGTHGAGPMTTGAHLHFEMMRNGAHVDPKGVLP